MLSPTENSRIQFPSFGHQGFFKCNLPLKNCLFPMTHWSLTARHIFHRLTDLIFKDFSRKPSKFKYFSSLCKPCARISDVHQNLINSTDSIIKFFIRSSDTSNEYFHREIIKLEKCQPSKFTIPTTYLVLSDTFCSNTFILLFNLIIAQSLI